MIIKESHIVPEGVSGIRIKDYGLDAFTLLQSRKAVTKAIKAGEIYIDGDMVETGRFVQTGQRIDYMDLQQKAPQPYKLEMPVIYEDEFIAVINKPAGIEVNGNKFKTVENALPDNLKKSSIEDALKWPRPVHRIDYSTSGLLIIAKTAKAQINLGKQFEARKIQKRYRAIVMGKVESEGVIQTEVDGRKSHSEYKTVKTINSLKSGFLSLVDLYPYTGRKHQLRVHMSSIGHPILGDKLYGDDENMLKGKGLFLCAVELDFTHPIHNTSMNIFINESEKFKTTLEREEMRYNKFTD